MDNNMEIGFRLGNEATKEFSTQLAERLKDSNYKGFRAEFHEPSGGGGGFQLGLAEAVVVGIATTLAKEVVSFLWEELKAFVTSKKKRDEPVPEKVQIVVYNQVFEISTTDIPDKPPPTILEATP